MIVIAISIRSVFNVGSIFRTCDAIGVEKLYLAGHIATPKTQPDKISKTALGAEKTVAWEYVYFAAPLLQKFKNNGYEIIALEYKKGKSVDFRAWKPKKKTVLILGNEVNGVSNSILSKCDKIVHLPMNGNKESLNVGVAFGAIGYYFLSK